MRRLLVLSSVLFTLGCRAPAIPAQPSAHEYTVLSAWIEQASNTFPHQLRFAIDSTTLDLRQNELQFRECLPRRMEAVFDVAPTAILTTSSNDWLLLSDGREAELFPHNGPPIFSRPTELFRVSRVALTLSGYDAWLWVEHQTCNGSSTASSCDPASGALLHGTKSDGTWTFEDTTCQVSDLPDQTP